MSATCFSQETKEIAEEGLSALKIFAAGNGIQDDSMQQLLDFFSGVGLNLPDLEHTLGVLSKSSITEEWVAGLPVKHQSALAFLLLETMHSNQRNHPVDQSIARAFEFAAIAAKLAERMNLDAGSEDELFQRLKETLKGVAGVADESPQRICELTTVLLHKW